MSIEDAFKSELGKEVIRLRKENQEVHAAVIRKQKELLKIRGSLVTEQCPECGEETTLAWNVAKQGYHVFCSNCGFPMMLCGECMADSGLCDWNGETLLCYRMVDGFWKNLSDVPFTEDEDGRLILEKEYKLMFGSREIAVFPAGTDREEIWHWFDEKHPKGVVYLMNGIEAETSDKYYSIENGHDVQIDTANTEEEGIRKCLENQDAKEVFAYKKAGNDYELLGCVFSKGEEDEEE